MFAVENLFLWYLICKNSTESKEKCEKVYSFCMQKIKVLIKGIYVFFV